MTDETDKDQKLDSDVNDESQSIEPTTDEQPTDEQPTKDTVLNANKEQEVGKNSTANAMEKTSKRTGRLAIIFFVIVILAVGLVSFGGWTIWQQTQQQLADMNAQNQGLADQLATAQLQINEVSNRRESYADNISTQIEQIEALVVQSAQRLNRQADQTENRWPLEEALTLTRLAQRRLFLDKDAAVSINLLASADSILASLDAAAVLPLREQLAKDMLALRNAKSVDLSGTYFELSAVADAVRQLTWLPKPALAENIEPQADLVAGFWQSIKQVVVVTRMDDIIQAPPLQSDFELWRQHTLMVLAQAQLALLAQNQTLYETALQQTIEQLQQMQSQFDFASNLEQLKTLKAYQLNPVWPDISNSVNKLSDYIKQQNEADLITTEEAQS